MNIIISVENLSKAYRLGQIGSGTLSRDLTVWWAKVSGKPNPMSKIGETDHGNTDGEAIWALKDVSFTVGQGEVLGIIGKNGAGKSTLLKILARVTAPTSGKVKVKGRIASLLEVGTGFHPDLTGRENIYLNGAILGMSRMEIDRKFEEIVAFSEVEKFIDTPVKRYSSGMYVRLAFSVAAHLEPEILLVDEVLAVGDAEFQKKCLGKMGDVAKEGRTVLFVSHNMLAISNLCPTTILINDGRLEMKGTTAQVINNYLFSESRGSAEVTWAFDTAPNTRFVKLHAVRILNSKHELSLKNNIDESIELNSEFWILRKTTMTISFHLFNQQGVCVFATGNFNDKSWNAIEHEPGLYSCSCVIPPHLLNDGRIFVTIYLVRDDNAGVVEIKIPEVLFFDAQDTGTNRGGFMKSWLGIVRPILPWNAKRIGELP
jgi:lipopolysaccharide transport system ATP-binding protein